MKFAWRFIDWFLYTSLLTACCSTALCMATERLVASQRPLLFTQLHVLVFGSTLLVYNTPRIVRKSYGRERAKQRFSAWYLCFFFIGIAMTVAGLYGLPTNLLVTSGLLGVFAFAYFLPLLPFGDKRRLRDFGWIKIAVLASVWTIATSVLPIMYLHKNIGDYPFELLLRFLFIFTLCVVFDIRDMQTDQQHHISTLPNKVGLKNSYRLITTTLLLFTIVSMLQYLYYPHIARLIGAMITAAATGIIVRYLDRHPSDRAYMGLADGVMLFYAVLVLC